MRNPGGSIPAEEKMRSSPKKVHSNIFIKIKNFFVRRF